MNTISLPGLISPHDLAQDRQFSMNLARGLEVLRVFTAASPVLGNREIAERTKLPKPTVSRLTYSLTLLGYLSRDSQLQKYRLGPGVLSLGYPLLASMQVRQVAKPLMESLARTTGCTVNLGVRDRDFVVYIDSVRADASNQHLPDIGSTRPLLSSAIGRALILACPPAEQLAIMNFLKVKDATEYATQHSKWEADSERFRQDGYCYSQGDWRKEIHAVAVPVRTALGGLPVALNCTLSSHREPMNDLRHVVAPMLKDAVFQLELTLGLR